MKNPKVKPRTRTYIWGPDVSKGPTKLTQYLLRCFEWDHLTEPLQDAVSPFQAVATTLMHVLPEGRDRTKALKKLLAARDRVIRGMIVKDRERK